MRTRSIASTSLVCVLILAATGCSCGDGDLPDPDAGPTDGGATPMDTGPLPDGPSMRCGNSMVEGSEECDDGNRDPDDGCAADCTLECGDGAVSGDELCDTAIAPGDTGACPSDCDDGDSCTTDALDGSECSAECSHGPITVAAPDDGCCPPGADSTTDNDCAGVCGNGLVEAGETCDTAIAGGDPGACPATCDDGIVCTTDIASGTGCTAACTNDPITAAMDGDGCCPSGATPATDDDCTGCGDGTVTSPETCDTAIASGAGSCPTMCNDGMSCTADSLVAAGSCMAACSFTAITATTPGDGCCPPGATIATDSDCAARCGDGVITAPETCDDGNTTAGDGCSATCMTETAPPTAFRLSDLDLRDPHVYARIILCVDATNTAFGMPGINPLLQDNIQNDGDSDGLLDLSIAHVFRPLTQAAGSSTPSDLVFPDCATGTSCVLPAAATRISATASNMGGGAVCLPAVSGTTRSAYSPAIVFPTAPGGGTCYVASAGTVTFDLGGIPITLTDAHIGGEWFGNPATEIRDGLIRGFLSQADANRTIIPDGTTGQDAIDCLPIGSLLPGGNPPPRTGADPPPPAGCADGTGAETPTDPPANCAGHSDLDTGPGGVPGWYFYLNFSAARVTTYSEM